MGALDGRRKLIVQEYALVRSRPLASEVCLSISFRNLFETNHLERAPSSLPHLRVFQRSRSRPR